VTVMVLAALVEETLADLELLFRDAVVVLAALVEETLADFELFFWDAVVFLFLVLVHFPDPIQGHNNKVMVKMPLKIL
jgi:hypothetical protein